MYHNVIAKCSGVEAAFGCPDLLFPQSVDFSSKPEEMMMKPPNCAKLNDTYVVDFT
jgi:hypothetical protein